MHPFKYLISLLLISITSTFYGQIDYKGLVKNIEEVTYQTDIEEYLKGLKYKKNYGDIVFDDERFIKYYGIVVDKVTFNVEWSNKNLSLELFNEEKDYIFLKEKLTELYGDAKINKSEDKITYNWTSTKKKIELNIKIEDERFSKFELLNIKLVK
ncbi:MAG: hypothetical protein L3J23_02460 [Flavobacteriaceae bacterium]|nr:hypothetical protein [Flavobacteriaceae bacterium]